MDQINEDYYKDLPHSYGGRYLAYDHYENINNRTIDDAYKQNDIYTRFRQHKKAKFYSPIYVHHKRQLLQCDTTFFTADTLVNANNGYKYLLCVIDVFTKMTWVYPMKKVTCESAVECLRDLFSKCGTLPTKIQTDKGSEFKCQAMKRLMEENGVIHYYSYSERKCAVVERFNLTIQQLLYKLMAKFNTYEWTKLIPHAMKIYLNRKHNTIKMSPLDAENDNNQEKLRNIYIEKYDKAEENRSLPKFKVGNTVRVWAKRTNFWRGYYEDFTREYFKINQVLLNLPVPRYKLEDIMGEQIRGSFFEDELILFNPPADMEYQIEKVVKERGSGRNKQFLVKYIGWPDKFNEWKSERELIQLR